VRPAAIVVGLGLAVASTALAAGPGKVFFEDTVPSLSW
jgi:hypothetical protein